MPWWLLGMSMISTTSSTNSANLFTEIIRQNGISGNWVWWAFLLTGMLTVFVYAKLWNRSGVLTDIEFYELRYSGKAAAFLRGFRAIYLGVVFNVISMALVTLAGIKIGVVMFGVEPITIMVIVSAITVIYCMMGGFRGVLITDFIQFIVVMAGAFIAMAVALKMPQVNGLKNLVSHHDIIPKLNFFPDISNKDLLIAVFIIPIAVQWWSVWYPGSEPGGGGTIAQRMLSAKNEKNSIGAALFHNVVHYGLRPWPWFIVALCSILVFPDLDSLRTAFPNVSSELMGNDLAYPAMLTFLPTGMIGLVVASLIAAHMSTISSQLNLGSSYIVNDFYKRFVRPGASEKQLVRVGRISTLLLMVLACLLAPFLQSAKHAFDLILQIGAGTGLLFILRWFWWRINAYSELTAMIVSFLTACYFEFIHSAIGLPELMQWQKLIAVIIITTFSWIAVTLITRPSEENTLFNFCRLVRAGGPGWKTIYARAEKMGNPIEGTRTQWDVPYGILCMVIACTGVYAALFATGSWIYSNYIQAVLLTVVAILATIILFKLWTRMYGIKKSDN
jgi:Na+/proline symporter